MVKFLKYFLILIAFFTAACSVGKDSAEYRIGIDPTWYPLSLPAREASILGYSKDLLQALAVMEKAPYTLVETTSENVLFDLKKGKYKGIFSSMQPYSFLQDTYDFSQPFLLTGPVLVVAADTSDSSPKHFKDKILSLPEETTDAMIVEKYPGAIIRFYSSIPDVLLALEAKEIDGAIVDVLTAEAYCADIYYGKLKVATEPLTDEGLRLITLHNQGQELQEAFSDGLAKLKKEKNSASYK